MTNQVAAPTLAGEPHSDGGDVLATYCRDFTNRSSNVSMPARRWVDGAPYGAALVLVALPFVFVAVHLATLHRPIYLDGDWAILDIDVRSALHWHLLLGPYDRFGWHHPGPTFAYLLSVVARLVGPGGVADDLGTVAINAGAALATVVLVRRRAGRIAALWAAVCLTSSSTIIGPEYLITAWGPNVVFLPTVLLAVLCADAAGGHRASLVGALAVATFEVQTQLATAPIVLALIATMVVIRGWRHRQGIALSVRPGRRYTIVIGWVFLVVMWLPPLIEQFQHLGHKGGPAILSTLHPEVAQVDSRSGNVVAIFHFLIAKHGTHSIGSVMSLLAPHPWKLALLGGACLIAILVGGRVADGLGASIGWMAVAAGIMTPLAVSRVVGGIEGFDLSWDYAVPVVAALGAGVSVFVRAPDTVSRLLWGRTQDTRAEAGWRRPYLWRLCIGVLIVVSAASGAKFASTMMSWRAERILSPIDTAAWQLVRGSLRGAPSVYVDAKEAIPYGIAASIADDLIAGGVRVTVPPGWAPEFGTANVSTGGEAAEVIISIGACAPSRLVMCLRNGNNVVALEVIRHQAPPPSSAQSG